MTFLERMREKSREVAKAAANLIPDDVLAPDAAERMAICEACPHLRQSLKQCVKCGCMMAMKTKLASAKCPIGKW